MPVDLHCTSGSTYTLGEVSAATAAPKSLSYTMSKVGDLVDDMTTTSDPVAETTASASAVVVEAITPSPCRRQRQGVLREIESSPAVETPISVLISQFGLSMDVSPTLPKKDTNVTTKDTNVTTKDTNVTKKDTNVTSKGKLKMTFLLDNLPIQSN